MNIMSDCCSISHTLNQSRNNYRCPVNGREYKRVHQKTIMHHISKPWKLQETSQNYYFCDDPECDVVYFGEDDSIIKTSDIRTPVGIKNLSGDALICYCFGVTVHDANAHPEIKEFVIEKTQEKMCECEARNPSGKCCLKYFSKL